MRLSYSSISMYTNCPLSYKFAYVDRLPRKKSPALSFGSSIHDALKVFYSVPTPSAPTLDELLNFLKSNWKNEGYEDKVKENSYFDHALKVLTQFYYSNVEDFYLPLATEYRFELNLNGITLIGVIDRVDKKHDGSLEIIDYKTSRKLPAQSRVDNDMQLSIYHLAVENLWNVAPEKLTFYFLLPDIKLSTKRTKDQTKETINFITKTNNDILEKKFQAKQNPLCPWCDYQIRCPLYKHKYDKIFKNDSGKVDSLINEYISTKEETTKLDSKLEMVSQQIHNYCIEHNLSQLFSEKYIISRKKRTGNNYNLEKLREILEPLNLWEEIIKVDPKILDSLVQSNKINQETKEKIESLKETEDLTYALYVKENREIEPTP